MQTCPLERNRQRNEGLFEKKDTNKERDKLGEKEKLMPTPHPLGLKETASGEFSC